MAKKFWAFGPAWVALVLVSCAGSDQTMSEPTCGDAVCNGTEACSSCAVDCGACQASCGDATCNGTETCSSCAADCGACATSCGNGTCNDAETCTTCASDCGACPASCGDGTCNGTETCGSCAVDCGACPASCGDDLCNGGETCTSCAVDCGACSATCGDATCDANESCTNCASDCGACAAVCGDAACNGTETCGTCTSDCGACPASCGDATCSAGFETCGSCPGDCGACAAVCGDAVCSGTETCTSCSADCGACPTVSDYAGWLDAYATLACQRWAACEGTVLTPAETEQCHVEVRAEFLYDVPIQRVTSGDLTFDVAWGQRLLDVLDAWPTCAVDGAAGAWNFTHVLFRGSVGQGGACGPTDPDTERSACAVGLRCDRSTNDGSPCTGTCQPLPGLSAGSPCESDSDCALPAAAAHVVLCDDGDDDGVKTCNDVAPQAEGTPNGVCSEDGDDPTIPACPAGYGCADIDWDTGLGTCRAKLAVGAACDPWADSECAGWDVSCIPDDDTHATFHCRSTVVVSTVGGDCDSNTPYGRGYRDCDWMLNLSCGLDGKCAVMGDGTQGSSCNLDSNCDNGLYCVETDQDSACLPPLANGADCDPLANFCVSDYCDESTSKCAPMPIPLDPGSAEACDGEDNDCDGASDEGLPISTVYFDQDGDGYGDAASSTMQCVGLPEYVAIAGDCNNGNAGVHPGANDFCNGVDDDCDGQVDEDVNPAATDVCDFVDNDCDGSVDEDATAVTFYYDDDGDGFGDDDDTALYCAAPGPDWVLAGGDCHPWNPTTYPGAPELCDANDNDCDDVPDEGLPGLQQYYFDHDGDGYGSDPFPTPYYPNAYPTCAAPDWGGTSFVLVDGDCNDANPSIGGGC